MPTDKENSKCKFIHWLLLIVCVFFYIGLNLFIVDLNIHRQDALVFNVSRYSINGIVAQGQIIAIILITLNPIKKSHHIALLLCGATCMGALINVLTSDSNDALPGIIVPITSAGIIMVINNYAKKLKDQLSRVLAYSRIVKEDQRMLHSLAYYDVLTGLPNRKMLMDKIHTLTGGQGQEANGFILVYLDIDNFKNINDTMGHGVGDMILKNVAQRWRQHCHEDDLLARVSGDEFIILVLHETTTQQLHQYLNGFRDALKAPFCIGRKDFNVCASFGITRFPDDGESAGELLKNADIALYKAKRQGKNDYQFFSRAMRDEVTRRIRLEEDLLYAVRNNELYMVYQPQYRNQNGMLRGFEALMRWKHPELGMISPVEFIQIAEETGAIIDIGRWAIEEVLRFFKAFYELISSKVVIAVNISVKQILEPSFVDMVGRILDKTGFDGHNLEFEITESVFISNPEYVIDVIGRLKELGIRIALDDFGTKYASLNHLQMLPINILKIDKTFIDRINPSHSGNQMTGAIIALSHRLGIEVVAEGVEMESQLNYLFEQGCDYIQGYLLNEPVGQQKIMEFYAQNFGLTEDRPIPRAASI